MKTTVSKSDFREAFRAMDRHEQFSYEGLGTLFDWLEELDECCDTEMELDVIALCCDFTEYADLEELQQNYTDIEDMDDLQNNTCVIMIDDDRFIIQDF